MSPLSCSRDGVTHLTAPTASEMTIPTLDIHQPRWPSPAPGATRQVRTQSSCSTISSLGNRQKTHWIPTFS